MKTLKKLILTAALGAASVLSFAQGRILCDENCEKESNPYSQAAPGEASYAVVSPVPRSSVPFITQAPRLETLEGKTIAVVGVSFMTHVTHPEIKRLILSNFPSAKVILLDEIGAAGVFPAPGVTRKAKVEFERKLREMKVDAVISGNGGCGLCTPKEMGSCLTAEYAGIPAVMIAAPGFTDQAYYTAINNGLPAPRIAVYPGAFASHTTDELIRNTREVLWPQIVEGLTKPISEEELAVNRSRDKGDIRDDVYYGTLDEINAWFKEMKWSDGLPVIPPTYEKVTSYLKYTDLTWDSSVATLPIAHRDVKVWHVAVNAVMAGCKPEYMPILLAMTKGLGAPAFRRTLASTHAWIPYCWLNGPVARQLGIDAGQGEINEAANVAIGRYMTLALMNLAGYYVKQDRMGTFGYPMSWTLVEDEASALAAGWKPYHVRKGFAAGESTITVSSTLLWGNNMAPSTTDPRKMMELLAWDISERCQFALGSGKQYTFRTILMTAPVARILAGKYRNPEALEEDLIEYSRRSVKERAFANYYANPGGTKDGGKHNLRQYTAHISKTEDAEMTPAPSWYDTDAAEMLTIPTMRRGMTDFIVTGDAARNKVQTMPGGGNETVRIELPSNWDALMQELGYRPLKEFFLK